MVVFSVQVFKEDHVITVPSVSAGFDIEISGRMDQPGQAFFRHPVKRINIE